MQQVLTSDRALTYNPYVRGIYCQKCGTKRAGMVCPKCGYPYVVIRFEYQGERFRLYRDTAGKPWTYSTAEIAKRNIDTEIEEARFDLKEWTPQALEERRFENAFERFLLQKKKKLRPSSLHTFRAYQRNHFTTFFAMDVREIKLKHLQLWYDTLPELSAKYRKNMVDCLRSFFNWLLRWGDLKELPIMPEIEAPDSVPRQALDYEGQIVALGNIPEMHRGVFEFLTETGLRPGEVCALKVRDIDFRQRALLVQRTYSKNVLVESTKGRHKMWVPLSDRGYEIAMNNIRGVIDADAFLFVNPKTEKGYTPEIIRRIWRKYSASSVDLYSATRHSFCTQLVEMGVSEIEAQGLMRHKDARSTRHYYHPTQERQREFLNKRTGKVVELMKRVK